MNAFRNFGAALVRAIMRETNKRKAANIAASDDLSHIANKVFSHRFGSPWVIARAVEPALVRSMIV